MHSFSSAQQQQQQTLNKYQEDLTLLGNLSTEQLTQMTKVIQKYTHSEDLTLLTSNDADEMSSILLKVAQAHHKNNSQETLRYLREAENLCQKAGMRDTLRLANCYLLHAKLEKENSTEYYLNEVDRICQSFGGDKEAQSLMLQAQACSASVYLQKNDHDKALEICDSILQKITDLDRMALLDVYQTMASVYQVRGVDQAFKFWKKALETAIELYGEASSHAFDIAKKITYLLKTQAPAHPEGLKYAEKHLQIAFKTFPKDSTEVAACYFQLASLHDFHKNSIEASISYEKSAAIFEKSSQQNKEWLEMIYLHLVRIHSNLGDLKKAKDFLTKADQLLEKYTSSKEMVADKYIERSKELARFGNMFQECLPYQYKALEIYKSIEPQNPRKIREIYGTLGIITFNKKDYLKAYELFKECEKYMDAPETNLHTFSFLYTHLGAICMHLERFDEAEEYILKVLQVSKEKFYIVEAGANYHNLAFIYEQKGREKEAIEFKKKALEMEQRQNSPQFLPEGLKYRN